MEKLAGDLLFGSKFVKLSILPTLFIHFVQHRLRELRSRYLGIKGLTLESNSRPKVLIFYSNSFIFKHNWTDIPLCGLIIIFSKSCLLSCVNVVTCKKTINSMLRDEIH